MVYWGLGVFYLDFPSHNLHNPPQVKSIYTIWAADYGLSVLLPSGNCFRDRALQDGLLFVEWDTQADSRNAASAILSRSYVVCFCSKSSYACFISAIQ